MSLLFYVGKRQLALTRKQRVLFRNRFYYLIHYFVKIRLSNFRKDFACKSTTFFWIVQGFAEDFSFFCGNNRILSKVENKKSVLVRSLNENQNPINALRAVFESSS